MEEDRRENLEEGFPTSCTLSAMNQKMKASIFAFKRGQSEKYTKDEGIIFTINGQTHGHLYKSFFRRDAVKLGYIADSILVIIDCTNFDHRSREDLFMNSRDRLRSGDLRTEIIKNLEDLLKNHPGLKRLNNNRRQEDIENKLEDSKPLADVIEQILKKSPTLSKLFIKGIRLPDPFITDKAKKDDKYDGKKFPTFFTLLHKFREFNPKICPINRRIRIQYKTDAVNDYFDRDSDPGNFSLSLNNSELHDYSLNLWNGTATLNIAVPGYSCVNDVLCFKSIVNDISRIEPFEEEFFINITEEMRKGPGGTGGRREPSSNEEGDETEKKSFLNLPNIREVRKNEWEIYKFDKFSALQVFDSGEKGYDFYVNMDNIYLLTEKKESTHVDSKLLDARYKYGLVLIGLAILKDNKTEVQDDLDNGEDIYVKIFNISRTLSPFLLPMISSLGSLEIEEHDHFIANEN